MKNYHKLVSAILLLFLIITVHHYSDLLYNKVITLYNDPAVQVKLILPAVLPEEDQADAIQLKISCDSSYCSETSKAKKVESVIIGV